MSTARVKEWEGGPVTPRTFVLRKGDDKARLVVPLPKENALRSASYRRWVASLPCIHCGKVGQSQCAHSDEGKGLSIKACDSTCYPACADGPQTRGCHSIIGASGMFSRSQRRTLEANYSEKTRQLAKQVGRWPKDWPQ